MLLGKNTNVRHKGVVFHVQTEDSGVARPHVITHLYHEGTILASEKAGYAELVKRPDLEARVRELMDEQHERMLAKLRAGELDGMLRERLAGKGGFAGGSDTKRVAKAEAPAPAPRREETIPAPTPDPGPPLSRFRREPAGEPTAPDLTPRSFGDGVITDRPLDEVILAYLVEKARHRKRLPK
jgi:hypothetical protein